MCHMHVAQRSLLVHSQETPQRRLSGLIPSWAQRSTILLLESKTQFKASDDSPRLFFLDDACGGKYTDILTPLSRSVRDLPASRDPRPSLRLNTRGARLPGFSCHIQTFKNSFIKGSRFPSDIHWDIKRISEGGIKSHRLPRVSGSCLEQQYQAIQFARYQYPSG